MLATSNAAVNGASNLPVLAPGLVVSLYGPDLADVTEVVFNGIPATVLASSANQINTVLPANLEPGPALVQVKRAGIASAGRIVKVDQYAPGIFSLNQRGEGPGMIVHADTLGLVSEADPARRGQHLSILCTGLGTGAEPTVTLGEVATHVLWSGPMPDVPGVNKVDIQVPEDAPRGATVQVLLRVGGAVSNSVTLAVE
ncbi:MAG: hypothetical protein JJE04_02705 [Acidobacteriia bacterium]|nr:hypothetical protein [Terriglobia bacterium]